MCGIQGRPVRNGASGEAPVQACAMPKMPTGCGGLPGTSRRPGNSASAVSFAHHVIVRPPGRCRQSVAINCAEDGTGGIVAHIHELVILEVHVKDDMFIAIVRRVSRQNIEPDAGIG